MNKQQLIVLTTLWLLSLQAMAQIGASCSNPFIIYPATSCSNTCGNQFCGNMQCPTGNCGSYVVAAGSSGGLNPSCSADNEATQPVVWLKVTATANNFTINNGSPYTGPSAANSNKRDYAVYKGSCGNLNQIACGTLLANASSTITGLTAGTTYFVMVSPADGLNTATATSICITSTVGYVAPGNNCSSAVSLTTNVTTNYTNAGATPDAVICAGSVENNVWYRWCAPANWPAGQLAYVNVTNQICNSAQGLQLSVWNNGNNCPTSTANPVLVCQNPGSLTQYYFQWPAAANQCYYITIDGYAGVACTYNLTVGSVVVLPVELLEFQATMQDARVLLRWTTASELNNDFFTIERSQDGQKYEAVLERTGAGTTSVTNYYNAIDEEPLSGVSYYRLKQTDFDGKSTYSETVAINNRSLLKGIRIAPNPANEHLKISIQANPSGEQLLRIINSSGQTVYDKRYQPSNDVTMETIDLSGLSAGVYTVMLENTDSVFNEILVRHD